MAWLRDSTQRPQGAVLVAEVHGVCAGYAASWVTHNDAVAETRDSNVCGYIADICVLAAYRGRGIAAALLSAAGRHLKQTGVTRLRIISLAANASAQTAYREYGFESYEIVFEKRA